jgi:hypothetical protein
MLAIVKCNLPPPIYEFAAQLLALEVQTGDDVASSPVYLSPRAINNCRPSQYKQIL